MPQAPSREGAAGIAADEYGAAEYGAAAELVKELAGRSLRIALAESCTAGLAAGLIAAVPGASRVLWGSFVCYTIDAKCAMLGLDRNLVEGYGAVSRETAAAMAEGALRKSGADIAVSVTGLAGPEGDGSGVPVGTVWIATAGEGGTEAAVFHYQGERNAVRCRAAAELVVRALGRLRAGPPKIP